MKERNLSGSPIDSLQLVELLTDEGKSYRPSRFALRMVTRDGTVQERDDLSLIELRALHAGITSRLVSGNEEMRQHAMLRTAMDARKRR